MSKNVSKLFFLSLLLVAVSCAPKRAAMPSYEGRTFREVLSDLQAIDKIETRFSIVLKKPGQESRGDGALDISGSGDMSLRVYSLGFLAMELVSRNGSVRSSPVLERDKTVLLTRGLRDCLFWWDIRDFSFEDAGPYYLLTNPEREIWIDKLTYLPVRQTIRLPGEEELYVSYRDPDRSDNVWYQSTIRIEYLRYAVDIKIKNIVFGACSEGGQFSRPRSTATVLMTLSSTSEFLTRYPSRSALSQMVLISLGLPAE